MKLLNATQIRQWDQYTIQHEPISSLHLMERAAKACTKWLLQHTLTDEYYIFCGKGNNGGDGLAIARLLKQAGKIVRVFILDSDAKGSDDYLANFDELHYRGNTPIVLLKSENELPVIPGNTIIIDALFGIGLNRKLEGLAAAIVTHINRSGNVTIAIDMPSGLFCDSSSVSNIIVEASHTLTFQCLKTAFLVAENERFFGQLHILDISLHEDFMDTVTTAYQLINMALCRQVYRPRRNFAHKGDFGHALLIAGSLGKSGAAVLCAKACLRTGVGLLTTHVPSCTVPVLQTAVPEAMAQPDVAADHISVIPDDLTHYNALGVGPGIGTEEVTAKALEMIFRRYNQPMVIDADALNIIALDKSLLTLVPEGSILTPHPKEFARLFGEGLNDFEKINMALQQAAAFKIILVLKGHHSFIALPDGTGYFNITGNAGMATGGSGDVLTGIITSLLAQQYTPADAAIFGVFLHGLAGDIAASKYTMESMIAGDIITHISDAFSQVAFTE